MAQVRYQDVPEVAPAENAPQDEQHIQANPEEFGGTIAKGAEQLGQGASNAAKFFGEVQADDATNTALTRANAALNKFRALNGADALNAQKPTQDEIDAAFKDGRDSLSTPAQQYQYDSNVRNYQQRYISGIMASHADEQAKAFTRQTNDNTANLHLSNIAQNPNDPVIFNDNMSEVINARVKQAQVEGQGPEGLKMAAADGRAQALSARIDSLAATGNAAGALQMLKDNQAQLSVVDRRNGVSYYDQLYGKVNRVGSLQTGVAAQRQKLSETYGNLPPPSTSATLPQVQSAIYGQESSSGKRTETSVTGAVGGMQVQPATFKLYARPGENIANPIDNKNVGDRILTDYYNKYNGDPYRVAVAYVSGPGNVAPPGSATPWINNKADPTGKNVASYVSDVAAKLGVAPIAPYTAEAAVERSIMLDGNLTDEAKQFALQENSRFFRESEIAMESSTKAKKDAADAVRDKYTTELWTLDTKDPQAGQGLAQKIAADPTLEGPAKSALMGLALTKLHLDDSIQYGNGFSDMYSRIFLPPGDPNRLDDPNEILRAGDPKDGRLTLNGVKELSGIFQSSRKNPDKAPYDQQIGFFLQGAKDQMAREQDVGPIKIPNPKGEMLYNESFAPMFVRQAHKLMDDAVQSGNYDKIDKFLSKENVDAMVDKIYPKKARAYDELGARDTVTGEKADQTIPAAPQGIDQGAWGKIMDDRPLSPNGHPVAPGNWAQALQYLRDKPTPQNVEIFSKEFGVDGTAILKSLNPAQEAPKPEAAPNAVAPVAAPAQLAPSEQRAQDDREAERLANEARERQGAIVHAAQERRQGFLQ